MSSLWWRLWACPRTVERAAADFLHVRNPPKVRAMLAAREPWGFDHATDFRRRIGHIYGLGALERLDRATDQEVWSLGWNRRLLIACGTPSDPIAGAMRILERVRALARSLPMEARAETKPGATPD